MSKVIDSLVQAQLDSKQFTGVALARLEFASPTGTLRYANTAQTVYWDESGAGEEAYLGVGNLASISVLPETSELAAESIQLTLSGIPNDQLQNALGSDYRGKPAYLYYGVLIPDTYAVYGGQSGPVLAFAGLIDNAVITFGKEATVSLTVVNRLADWERARGGRYNDPYQTTYVDPLDAGFSYVKGLQYKEVVWGGENVLDPGGGGSVGGNNGNGGSEGNGGTTNPELTP